MKNGKGFGLGSLILGILSVILLFFGPVAWPVSVIAGVAGVVAGFIGKNQGYNKIMFIIGVCTSLIGLVVGGCLFLF